MASNSYPKDVKKFILWSKAMVAGATVDRPNYSALPKTSTKLRRKRKAPRRSSRKRRARRTPD